MRNRASPAQHSTAQLWRLQRHTPRQGRTRVTRDCHTPRALPILCSARISETSRAIQRHRHHPAPNPVLSFSSTQSTPVWTSTAWSTSFTSPPFDPISAEAWVRLIALLSPASPLPSRPPSHPISSNPGPITEQHELAVASSFAQISLSLASLANLVYTASLTWPTIWTH